MKTCKMCKTELKKEKNTFCSLSCSTKYRNLSKCIRVKKECKMCGKVLELTESSLKGKLNVFCSNECRQAFLKRNNRYEPCENCGKIIEINWKRNKVKTPFCSVSCHNEKVSNKVETTCAGCGGKMITHKSRLSYYKNVYCSQNCYTKTVLGKRGNLQEKYELVRHRLMDSDNFRLWRIGVLSKKHRCEVCGSKKGLVVHHVISLFTLVSTYNREFSLSKESIEKVISSKEFNDVSNGKVLCKSCHVLEHRKIVPYGSNSIEQIPLIAGNPLEPSVPINGDNLKDSATSSEALKKERSTTNPEGCRV